MFVEYEIGIIINRSLIGASAFLPLQNGGMNERSVQFSGNEGKTWERHENKVAHVSIEKSRVSVWFIISETAAATVANSLSILLPWKKEERSAQERERRSSNRVHMIRRDALYREDENGYSTSSATSRKCPGETSLAIRQYWDRVTPIIRLALN